MSETVTTWLRRRARRPILPGEAHRDHLESELAARFGTARKETNVPTLLVRVAAAAGILAAVGAGASQVPATYEAEVGKRVEIRTPAPPPPDAVRAAVHSLESGAREGKRSIDVRVRVTAEPGGGAVTRIDAFGDTIGMDGIPDAVRASSPVFAGAEIAVQPVQGKVEGDLGGLVGTKVLGERLDAAQIEEAIRSRLAAEGKGGDVRVEVKEDGSDGQARREVRVIVEKKEEAGAR